MGEETCLEVGTAGARRIIYFYTQIGKSDDFINCILMNFKLEIVMIIHL